MEPEIKPGIFGTQRGRPAVFTKLFMPRSVPGSSLLREDLLSVMLAST
jgi:hypothetical protein